MNYLTGMEKKLIFILFNLKDEIDEVEIQQLNINNFIQIR